MSSVDVSKYDSVELADGRIGTIVEIYQIPGLPIGYEIELEEVNEDGEYELITVKAEDIIRKV